MNDETCFHSQSHGNYTFIFITQWAVGIKASNCFQAKAPPLECIATPLAKAIIAYTRMHSPLLVLTPVA